MWLSFKLSLLKIEIKIGLATRFSKVLFSPLFLLCFVYVRIRTFKNEWEVKVSFSSNDISFPFLFSHFLVCGVNVLNYFVYFHLGKRYIVYSFVSIFIFKELLSHAYIILMFKFCLSSFVLRGRQFSVHNPFVIV